MRVFLAHGIFGPFDELVYMGGEIVFFVTVGLAWLRSRRTKKGRKPTTQANPAGFPTDKVEDLSS